MSGLAKPSFDQPNQAHNLKTQALKRPKNCQTTAAECRRIGLKVGDTIVGRETYSDTRWSEAKLTLLWVGKEQAVWRVQRRSHEHPRWKTCGESSNWTLACRDWRKVLPSDSMTTAAPASA